MLKGVETLKKASKDKLFGTQKQQLKDLTKEEYLALRTMSHLAKNMYNVGLYNVRQYYFENREYLSYESNYPLCRTNENYEELNSNIAQQILKEVDGSFKSFFSLIRLAKEGKQDFKSIRLPEYLEKDGFFSIIIGQIRISKHGILSIPMSPAFRREYGSVKIKVPDNLKNKKIKEIRIIPKYNARFFEIQYVYEIPESEEKYNPNNALAIDLGLDNLCTCTTNHGDAFIIDGKRLKSINQGANKQNKVLRSNKDKRGIEGTTRKQQTLWNKRNNKVNDYISKTCSYIIKYCIENDIGNIVIGYNPELQRNCNMGRSNNQNFVIIPFGRISDKLDYLCTRNNIEFHKQEESYTSKSDFLVNDLLPVFEPKKEVTYIFSGKRISRGQYQSAVGKVINADVNGSLNILRKLNIVNLTKIQCSSDILKQPSRIKIA
ncbi:MAG: IS200/IS605 family element transposase accessory protein TnpB [Clostridiales bacterium]|nr:IS200/IS605 family element transposase accessory protein TnpB [Clostridiales bacterium]